VRVPTGRTARTLPGRAVLGDAVFAGTWAFAGWPEDAEGMSTLVFAIGSWIRRFMLDEGFDVDAGGVERALHSHSHGYRAG
jgi:hypothetical protein